MKTEETSSEFEEVRKIIKEYFEVLLMMKVIIEADDKIRTDMYSARWHFYKNGKEVHLDDLSLAEKQGLRIGCNTIVYDIENGLDYMGEIENMSRGLDESSN